MASRNMDRLRSTPWHKSFFFTCALITFSVAVQARPQIILYNDKFKCVHVEVPKGTKLYVSIVSIDFEDGFQTNVSIEQPQISRPDLHEMTEDKGMFEFLPYKDGPVQACIKSREASYRDPKRFHVSIDVSEVDLHKDRLFEQEMRRVEVEEKHQQSMIDLSEKMDHHVSRLEEAVADLHEEIKFILKEADYATSWEKTVFNDSISMYNEAKYWPMLQIAVICTAGIVQAQHIVAFFQKRKLI